MARETGLSAATVSTLVRELTDQGRLVVLADGAGRRGRVLGLARENGLVVGVGIGHTHVRVAVADMTHRVLGERTLDLDVDSSVDAVIVASLSLGDDLLAEHGSGHDGVLGLGVAVPGPIDDRTRSVGSPAILPGWVRDRRPGTVRDRLGGPGDGRERRQPGRARRDHVGGGTRAGAMPSTSRSPRAWERA